MAKVAVDLDSTLYSFEEAAREAMFKLYRDTGDERFKVGAYHAWTEWRSPVDAMGLDAWMEAVNLCHDDHVILDRRPFPGAVETCQALLNEGHEIIYISNRRTESTATTIEWLAEWDFLCDEGGTEVRCLMDDKAPYIKHCQYLIDDRPKTAIDFIYDFDWQELYGRMHDDNIGPTFKRRAFLKAYPFNQNLTDIPHLYLAPTWSGLNEYLVGKGVLSKPAYEALT